MTLKSVSLAVMSLLYVVGGIAHFVKPEMYLKIMPRYLPAHGALVFLSGVAEVALGVGLLIPATQVWAAWGLIALLVAIFPANIYMYQLGGAAFGFPDWALLARLPLQAVLIAWAYWHTR